ncbi:hypothetical protein B0E33_01585 [Roseibium algicola]|uniref:RecT family protein n=1 Tax=Roseibium algicola TaxID=2857014 RepID=A0ABM6HWL4_9HYPH|nr:recombinase RecT [Roseibium aggregatum]AQQ02444.1 hypothetical protein B0E33_01585 [Roseibium aggregatum]
MNQAPAPQDALELAVHHGQSVSIDHVKGAKLAPQSLGEVLRFADIMSRADIALPKHLRNNPGACMAVALQALEWDMSPFAVASKSFAVNGQIAYEAQLIAAVVNTRSGIQGRLRYEFAGEGDSLTCTLRGTIDGEEYSYTSPPFGAITTKNSPLWKTDPQQQLGYYSARAWARRYTPEVLLGVYDKEEAASFQGADNARDVTPARATGAERLAAAKRGQEQPEQSFLPQEGFNLDHVNATTAQAAAQQDKPDHSDNTRTLDLAPVDNAPLHHESENPAPAEKVPAEQRATDPLASFKAELSKTQTLEAVDAVKADFAAGLNQLRPEDKKQARLAISERKEQIEAGK